MSQNTGYVYSINHRCSGCGLCIHACPHDAILFKWFPFSIDPEKCDHCGKCRKVCPRGAVDREKPDVVK